MVIYLVYNSDDEVVCAFREESDAMGLQSEIENIVIEPIPLYENREAYDNDSELESMDGEDVIEDEFPTEDEFTSEIELAPLKLPESLQNHTDYTWNYKDGRVAVGFTMFKDGVFQFTTGDEHLADVIALAITDTLEKENNLLID